MPIVMLKDVTMRFPALATPQAFGEGEPAYGAKFPIAPGSEVCKQIEEAMLEAATQKWKEDGKGILGMLSENKKTCFERKPYRSQKTGEVYNGFEDMYSLGSRTPSNKPAPTVFNEFGQPITAKSEIERQLYDGCKVNAKVEIWAQDNKFGKRINCSLLGVMFAGEGQHFGGGSGPASADDFSAFAKTPTNPLEDASSVL